MTTMCPPGFIYNSTHTSWVAAQDKVEVLKKKGLDAICLERSTLKPEYLVFQSQHKRRTKDIIYETIPVKFRNGWETHLRANGKNYFSWQGAFFAKKDSAERDLKKIIFGYDEAARKDWGFQIFRTKAGWGVFAVV